MNRLRSKSMGPSTTKLFGAEPTSFRHPVRVARTAAGFTQQSLADAIGITRQTIISIEGGEYAPSVVLAIRIARACHTDVETLWGPAADAASE
jgi:putative transcriptional regulator